MGEIIEAMSQIDPDVATLDRAEELYANCGNYSYNYGLASADTLVHVYVPELLDMGRKYVAAKRAIADLEASIRRGLEDVAAGRTEYLGRFTDDEPEPDYGPRPDGCCGTCPPILGGGYDCTCVDNPRCNANHADRIDRDGDRWAWCDECGGFWDWESHGPDPDHNLGKGWTAAEVDNEYGPLTFAHRPAPAYRQ